ncbi:MAG: Asp23/Gls24 family envelope stress response protein [Lachnospiraceae bacterium]|nr:Asp23/Gls24 family envelope stress response protein [Lachnospiraceae bacterium]
MASEKLGNVRIATDVIARIAGMAALDVEGVDAVQGNLTREDLSRVGRNALGKGVRVSLSGRNAVIDLSLIMGYGYNIPVVCKQVQDKVGMSVNNMTDLTVTDVNVAVAGIAMQDA